MCRGWGSFKIGVGVIDIVRVGYVVWIVGVVVSVNGWDNLIGVDVKVTVSVRTTSCLRVGVILTAWVVVGVSVNQSVCATIGDAIIIRWDMQPVNNNTAIKPINISLQRNIYFFTSGKNNRSSDWRLPLQKPPSSR
jgi:hypothetical protein